MGNFILETIEKEHNRMALNVAALAGDILLASGACSNTQHCLIQHLTY